MTQTQKANKDWTLVGKAYFTGADDVFINVFADMDGKWGSQIGITTKDENGQESDVIYNDGVINAYESTDDAIYHIRYHTGVELLAMVKAYNEARK